MRELRALAGLAAIAFIVFLLARAPAALLAALAPADLRLGNTQGTVWSGQALSVRVGQLRLGPTSWEVSPWQLTLGRLAGNVDTTLPGGFARGRFALGIGGRLRLEQFTVAGSLGDLVRAVGGGLPVQDGRLTADIQVLEIQDGWPQRVVAQLRVAEIALVLRNGRPVQDQLASFELQLNAEEVAASGEIEANLVDLGGPLEVVGLLRLTPPRNYEMTGRAAARPSAPPDMQQALLILGPKNPAGGHDFTFAGSF